MSTSHADADMGTAAGVSTGNAAESSLNFIPRGAILQEFKVAGHNIVQNFPEANLYETVPHPHFGETIGRTTNRIKAGKIHNLNGKTYELAQNNGGNNLHGGPTGWGRRDWEGPKAVNRKGKEGVEFKYLSRDGEEGFPGDIQARVWYMAAMEDGKTVLEVEYEAELVGDECEETVIGMTNHRYFQAISSSLDFLPAASGTDVFITSYFNLNLPSTTVADTIVTLGTNLHLEIAPDGIPTGRIITFPTVPSTPNTPFTLTVSEPDPDDCFIMNPNPSSVPIDTRSLPPKQLITMYHPNTGLHLVINSTEPAFQFYAGRFVDVPEVETSGGVKVAARGKRCGICVEPSRYVNAAGREEWRGMCRLRKGEVFGARTIYQAWKD
ncbi:hypothetical protein MMC14_004576 [Varicellaria rhodocarpa]|nr:hypothetical protein [Varicellaria rhodocarpa]